MLIWLYELPLLCGGTTWELESCFFYCVRGIVYNFKKFVIPSPLISYEKKNVFIVFNKP